ncbi:MAG: hypothetical protein AB8B97_01560 [Granulosicoccus sp.]
MTKITGKTQLACVLVTVIAGCSTDADESNTPKLSAASSVLSSGGSAGDTTESEQWSNSPELAADGANDLAAVLNSGEIPYPLYPNGSKYRIGGEGDLRIVLFQTQDSFEEVDAYYQKEANMPRLSAMSDYVRYSIDNDDIDPWETSRPGIVIHQFNNESEREAVGADGNARTNIIMSF